MNEHFLAAVLSDNQGYRHFEKLYIKTVWPSGLRRWLKAPFRKGVGSNLTAVISTDSK